MKKKSEIIFISPLPPPITGQSIISQILLKELSKDYKIIIIDYSRKDIKPISGFDIKQIIKSIKLSNIIKKKSNTAYLLYLTLSMSTLGNLKDLLFLFRAGKKLRKKTIIHLHSGGFDIFYKRAFFIIKILNNKLLSSVSAGIVLSKSLKKCLMTILPEKKIKVVNNFFNDKLLINRKKIIKKWSHPTRFNMIFLSNFIKEKGYNEFLEGYFLLPEIYKDRCNIYFAGIFNNEKKRKTFLKRIFPFKNIKYLDFINEVQKKNLLYNSHALFLPTYYEIEGQPVTILESYAAGLTVFTTDQGGISDIFIDKINGEFIEKKSATSIKNAIIRLIDNSNKYKKYAINNREIIKNYTEKIFISKMKKIFQDVINLRVTQSTTEDNIKNTEKY